MKPPSSCAGTSGTRGPVNLPPAPLGACAAVGPKMDQLGSGQYVMPRDMDAERREAAMRRFREADIASMTPEVKAKMLTGGYDPVVDEEDEYASLLRMIFFKNLLDQMEGGDPPTPYTVQAGPAARAFPTMPSM